MLLDTVNDPHHKLNVRLDYRTSTTQTQTLPTQGGIYYGELQLLYNRIARHLQLRVI